MVVVVKIGTSSLTDGQGIIRREAIEKLCLEVAGARESGHQVVIVTSGAIGAGLPALGLGGDQRPRDSQTLQAVSAVGQVAPDGRVFRRTRSTLARWWAGLACTARFR